MPLKENITNMKAKFFSIVLILTNIFVINLFSQSTKNMQEILMSKKWYPDIYDKNDKETSFFTFTKTQQIDSTITEEGDLEIYTATYYLSDTLDEVFKPEKVGKATKGQYMILNTSHTPSVIYTFRYKLIEVSEGKIVIQHLTPGMSIYGHINTCYAIPPKRE